MGPRREEGVGGEVETGRNRAGGAAGLGPRREEGVPARRRPERLVREALRRGSPAGRRGVVVRRGLGAIGTGGTWGWGPHRRKRASEKQGWRGRWYFREGPRREEGAAERWGWRGGCGWCFGEREPAGRKERWKDGVGGGRLGKRAEGAGREKEPPGGGSQSCIVYSSFFRSSSGLSGWR